MAGRFLVIGAAVSTATVAWFTFCVTAVTFCVALAFVPVVLVVRALVCLVTHYAAPFYCHSMLHGSDYGLGMV